MEYLPTLGLFKITLGVNVGNYSIHGSLGYEDKTNDKPMINNNSPHEIDPSKIP